MLRYIAKRVGVSIVTLFTILLLLFLMLDLMPGSPFNDEKLTLEQRAIIAEKYELDRPAPERFVKYMSTMLQGDFGQSYSLQKDKKINEMLPSRMKISFQLGISAVVVGSLIGGILGIIAALKHNTWLDTLTSTVAVAGVSVPSYVFALLLLILVGYQWRLVPVLYNPAKPISSSILR